MNDNTDTLDTAIRLYSHREWEPAIAMFRRLMALHPEQAVLYVYLARAIAGTGKIDEAIAILHLAIQQWPDNPRFLYETSCIFLRSQRFDEAVPVLHGLVTLRPKDATNYCGLACAYRQQGKLNEAYAAIRNCLRLDSGYSPAHCELAYLHFLSGDRAEAEYAFGEAIRLDPANAYAHYGLGWLLKKELRDAQALPFLQRAVRLKPDLFEGYFDLAVIYERQNDLEEAVRAYREAVQINPKHTLSQLNLVEVLSRKGDQEAVCEVLLNAIRADEYNFDLHSRFVTEKAKLSSVDQIVRDYRSAIHAGIDDVSSYVTLGIALSDAGDYRAAVTTMRKAVGREVDNMDLRLGLVRLLISIGKFRPAIREVQWVLQRQSTSASAHWWLGYGLEQAGHPRRAIPAYERSSDLDPCNATKHIYIARLLLSVGMEVDARRHISLAARYGNTNDAQEAHVLLQPAP